MVDKIKKYLALIGLYVLVNTLVLYDVMKQWSPYHWALTLASGVLIFMGITLNLERMGAFFRGKKAAYGVNFFLSIGLFVVVISLANVFAVRHNFRHDATSDRSFSLSEHTVKILKGLKETVHLRAFYRGDSYKLTDTLQKYRNQTTAVQWEVLDLEKYPDKAVKFNVRADNTLVVECGSRAEQTEIGLDGSVDERSLTAAVLRATQDSQKKVYFTAGHGEKSLKENFAIAAELLRNSNYAVEEVNLALSNGVPEDCKVLVLAGPEKDLLPQEKKWLEEYSARGGAALFMADSPPFSGMADLLSPWGVKAQDDIVIDPRVRTYEVENRGFLVLGREAPVVDHYPDSPITRGVKSMSVFPMTRSLETVSPAPKGVVARPFVVVDDESAWGETDIDAFLNREVERDEKTDVRPPLTIGLAVEKERPGAGEGGVSRTVVFGDSDFATDRCLRLPVANGDILVNAVNWLAKDEGLISIRPREPADRRIFLTMDQQKWFYYAVMVMIPQVPFLVGLVITLLRRRKQ